MRFTVVLVPDEELGGYVAYVPAIPGCTTQGDTLEEAFAMAQDAATGLSAVLAEDGEDFPTEPAGAVISSVEVAIPELAAVGAQTAAVQMAD